MPGRISFRFAWNIFFFHEMNSLIFTSADIVYMLNACVGYFYALFISDIHYHYNWVHFSSERKWIECSFILSHWSRSLRLCFRHYQFLIDFLWFITFHMERQFIMIGKHLRELFSADASIVRFLKKSSNITQKKK